MDNSPLHPALRSVSRASWATRWRTMRTSRSQGPRTRIGLRLTEAAPAATWRWLCATAEVPPPAERLPKTAPSRVLVGVPRRHSEAETPRPALLSVHPGHTLPRKESPEMRCGLWQKAPQQCPLRDRARVESSEGQNPSRAGQARRRGLLVVSSRPPV